MTTITPTTTMPASSGFLYGFNNQTIQNNLKFAAWLEALQMTLAEMGVAIVVDFRPGAQTNKIYTPSDFAWLTGPEYNILCQQGMMGIFSEPEDAAGWVKTQISNQKIWGKVELS